MRTRVCVLGDRRSIGVVLGQVRVAAQSNEIPALRTLLEVFDLAGAVVTADAGAHPDHHRGLHHRPRRWSGCS
jgi:hypothetical protein